MAIALTEQASVRYLVDDVDRAVDLPGGWNRIHLIVDDITADVERLRAAGLNFRSDVISGPGGQQILLHDPAGNLIELFQPARR